jgi:hypothetical protein
VSTFKQDEILKKFAVFLHALARKICTLYNLADHCVWLHLEIVAGKSVYPITYPDLNFHLYFKFYYFFEEMFTFNI